MGEQDVELGQVPSSRRTRVFLSYSRQDAGHAIRIRNDLLASNIEVLRDVDSTQPGEVWWKRLQELIESADVIVFVLSSRSASSSVCASEIRYSSELRKRIIPVLIEAVQWREVPEGLARVHGVDMLDASAWETSISSLLLAINTDIAVLREHTRLLERALRWQELAQSPAELLFGDAIDDAERWLSRFATASIAATPLQSSFILASREAQRIEQQRLLEESEAQRKAVERERDRAVASFQAGLDVLTGVHDRLLHGLATTRGVSLVTREAVTRTLLEANKRITDAGPDFYPSSVQMQLANNDLMATSTLGEILLEQGKYEEAEATVAIAMEKAKAFSEDDYNPLQRRPGLRQYAKLLASLADLRYRQENLPEAIDLLSASIDLRSEAVDFYTQHGPAADVRHDLADGLQRLSVLFIVSGRFDESLAAARQSLAIIEKLAEEDPDNPALRHETAGILSSVGDGLFETGQWEEAEDAFRKSADIFDEMLANYPDSLFLLRAKSISLERLGNVEVRALRYPAALVHYEACLQLKERLIQDEPGNVQFAQDWRIIDSKIRRVRLLMAA